MLQSGQNDDNLCETSTSLVLIERKQFICSELGCDVMLMLVMLLICLKVVVCISFPFNSQELCSDSS